MIVADANLLVYRFIQGAKTGLARRVSERDDDWVVPSLWRHEFANALAMAVREAGLPIELALSVCHDVDASLSEREQAVNVADALQLSAKHEVSVYDAEYVVLAQLHRVPLVTEDRELLRKFPGTAVSMKDFISPRPGGAVREQAAAHTPRRRKPAVSS